jgi:hypothetical protein
VRWCISPHPAFRNSVAVSGIKLRDEIMMLRTILSTMFTVIVLLAVPQPVLADHHERGWHGNIRHFEAPGGHRWGGGRWYYGGHRWGDGRWYYGGHRWGDGRWYHGWHDGHLGWWWIVAGMWYLYPALVHPYPDTYVPPVVVEQQPPVIIQQAPPATVPSQPPAAAPRAPQYWYYCRSAKAYYPYVSSCPSGWMKVPTTPPDALQQ